MRGRFLRVGNCRHGLLSANGIVRSVLLMEVARRAKPEVVLPLTGGEQQSYAATFSFVLFFIWREGKRA